MEDKPVLDLAPAQTTPAKPLQKAGGGGRPPGLDPALDESAPPGGRRCCIPSPNALPLLTTPGGGGGCCCCGAPASTVFRLASATPSPEWWLNPCADRLGLIEVPPICGETSRGEGAAVEEADGPTETERGVVAGKRDLTGEVGCERARADMLEGECNGGPPLAAGTPFRPVVGGAKELDMGELAKTPAEWGGAGWEAEARFSVWIAGAVVTDRNGTGRFPRENVLPEERLLDATAAEKALVAAEWSSGCPGVGKGELPVEFGTLWNT